MYSKNFNAIKEKLPDSSHQIELPKKYPNDAPIIEEKVHIEANLKFFWITYAQGN